jgi:hypothetical protein
MRRRSAVAVAVAALATLLPASLAGADTGSILEAQHVPATPADGWQAGPCTTDLPLCTPQTPAQFYKTAGGHPPKAFVQFIIRHAVISLPGGIVREPLAEPIEARIPRTVRVDLPPGLSVNPEATPEKCSVADFLSENVKGELAPTCRPGSKIGESQVKIVAQEPFGGIAIAPGTVLPFKADLFNIQPQPGEPALFGMVVAGSLQVLLHPRLSWESDYHESFSIEQLPDYKTVHIRLPGFGGGPAAIAIHTARLTTFGEAGDGTLATLPTTCFNSDDPQFSRIYSSWIRVESYGEPDPSFPFGTRAFESPLPAGVHPEGCASVPFDPSLAIDPGTDQVDSPAPATVTARLPVEAPGSGGGPIAESQLRSAEVALPEGMGLNPAGAKGLLPCSDARFHKGDRVAENECPASSEIGSAEIRSPVLSQPLTGDVYVGEQQSTDPASGQEFRALVEAKAPERGVVVRLVGQIKADPATGQLTAVFDEHEVSPLAGALPHGLPQLPLESVTLRLDADHKVLSSPPSCAPAIAIAQMEPWARPGTEASPSANFSLTSLPGGGQCPQSLGERPFSPTYAAAPDQAQAGAYSPFRLHLARPDGQQELKGVDLTLPSGLLAKLAGIPYCPEAAIAAAASRSAAAEQGAPSCPAASQVGATAVEAGTGPSPLSLPGRVYLAGPYRGAPLSLAAITPARSGPFDLGAVVVRVALYVDPTSAQVHAVSDPLPDVFGGVKLDLRSLRLDLDRPGFTLNPTSCAAKATSGSIAGGGEDPANPASQSSYPFNAPFQASGCDRLDFAPTLTTTLSGPTRRGAYPQLSATLQARAGDANIASLSLALPHSLFAAQEHFAEVCTRPALASHSCPPSSVYGEAQASSPLLDRPLQGPVYLVPGGGKLPDLVADLSGQLEIQLHGAITATKGGGIQASFDSVPDVPVAQFTLRMAGGRKGLIVNSANLCKGRQLAKLEIRSQGGQELANPRYRLSLPGCKGHRRHRRHGRRRHRHAQQQHRNVKRH